jgi:hypothetical protein
MATHARESGVKIRYGVPALDVISPAGTAYDEPARHRLPSRDDPLRVAVEHEQRHDLLAAALGLVECRVVPESQVPTEPQHPRHGRHHSMGGRPASARAALAREKGREPKKPLWADSGDGWADSMTVWRLVSMSAFFLRA